MNSAIGPSGRYGGPLLSEFGDRAVREGGGVAAAACAVWSVHGCGFSKCLASGAMRVKARMSQRLEMTPLEIGMRFPLLGAPKVKKCLCA